MPHQASRPIRHLVSAAVIALVASALGSVSAPPPASADPAAWDVTTSPPALSNPTRIELSAQSPTRTLVSWGILCSGSYYRIDLDPNEDAIITMSGDQPLRYPVWVMGGRNVQLVGLEMDMTVQPGCGAGELPNTGSNARSIHPRLPGAMAVRLQNYGTAFVEGLDIDLAGHESDCFVFRNPSEMSNEVASHQRNLVIQNTSCTGIEGLGASSIGDGVHGDLLQNQGDDVMNSLTIENVTVRSSMEGLVLHRAGSYSGARSLLIRRLDYAVDERFANDDAFEQLGLAFDAFADQWSLDQVYINDPNGNDYGFVNRQRYGAFATSLLIHHEGILHGPPSGGAFAPADRVGLGYQSPHGANSGGRPGGTSESPPPTLPFGDGGTNPGQDPSTTELGGQAGAITRLYQATFGRSPDTTGLRYWQAQMESGLTLSGLAENFILVDEWKTRYGDRPSNSEIVDALYANILGRTPDGPGRSYWLSLIGAGRISRSGLLVSFSESAENRIRTGTH